MVNKRYYWLKLQETFFSDKRIKRLRKIAGGDTYTIIYLKLLLLSLQDEGKLFFENVEESFIEELALELDEDADNVQVTINYLLSKGMLEIVSDDEFFLTELPAMVGSETASTRRSRKSRAKAKTIEQVQKQTKALQCNTNATSLQQIGNGEIDIEIDKDKDKEIDIYVEKEEEQTNKFISYLNQIILSYKLTDAERRTILQATKNLDNKEEYLKRSIDYMKEQGKDVKTDFGYLVKMLKEQWDLTRRPAKQKTTFKKTAFHNFDNSNSEQYSEENLKKLMDRGR